jgi:hypothetical protein
MYFGEIPLERLAIMILSCREILNLMIAEGIHLVNADP